FWIIAAIMERTVSLDMADPWTLAASLAMLALLVPTCRLTVRLLGRRGTLDSVARRFRWALFRSFVLVALPVTAASVGLSLILSPAPIRVTASTLPLLVVALLLVPFQAAGEEYLFRGLLPQVVGGWLRSQWWGVAISVPLFTLGHSYDAPGLVGVGLFGVAASWVTWRSGGLEAAVALHAVNNLSAFGLGALGISDLNATVVTWPDAVLFSAIPVCFVAIYELRRRRALAARDQTPAVAHVAVIE
ncbi:MAG TPA: CPBP family intramembrane metalloprotease, partial [Propionibacteriaceae bacterium]|nr:CPBP family intramembrane metalloprotease [Propionibacteriaceae bacterium]